MSVEQARQVDCADQDMIVSAASDSATARCDGDSRNVRYHSGTAPDLGREGQLSCALPDPPVGDREYYTLAFTAEQPAVNIRAELREVRAQDHGQLG
jgi:hypothetical protein